MQIPYDLRPYQREGVDYIKSRKYILLADDMGIGKTIQSLAAAVELGAKKVLVICPATIINQWAEKIEEFYPEAHIFKSSTSNAKFTCRHFDISFAVFSYNMAVRSDFHRSIQELDWDLAIIDEAHFLKNCDAQRTNKILGKNSFLTKAKKILLLTGTPVVNRPADIYLLLKVFAKDLLGKYANEWLFMKHFCGYMGKGASNTDELAAILQKFMLRRTKEEVSDQLPDLIENFHNVDIKIPENLEYEYLPTQRRMLALAKVEPVVNYIHDLLQTIDKIVIITYHKEVLEQLLERLSEYNPRGIYGGLSPDSKDKRIKDFINDDSCRICIGQINTLGYGVDGLQKVCSRLVFAELDWTPSGLRQTIDRLRRIGQEANSVFVDYIIANDSLDDYISKKIRWKENVIDTLTGDKLRKEYEGEVRYLDILEKERNRLSAKKDTEFVDLSHLDHAILETKKRLNQFPSSLRYPKIEKKETKQMAKEKTVDDVALKLGTLLIEALKTVAKSELAGLMGAVSASPTVATAAEKVVETVVEMTLDEIKSLTTDFLDGAEAAGVDRKEASEFYRTKILSQFNIARTADGTPEIWSKLKTIISGMQTNGYADLVKTKTSDDI